MHPTAPADPTALFDLGNTLFARGRIEAAIQAFQQCLIAAPDNAGTHYNLGNTLLRAGRPVEAIEAYLCCIRLAPKFGPGYVNLADTLRRLGLLDQARWAAATGLELLAEVPEAQTCLASVLHDSAEYERAAALYRKALDQAPTPGTLTSLGNTLRAMGRLADALDAHERALAAAPGDAEVRFSRAITLLAAGDWERGFPEYEWRWQRRATPARAIGRPWNGEAPAGRTILLGRRAGAGRHAAIRPLRGAGGTARCHSRAGGSAGVGAAVQDNTRNRRNRAAAQALPPFDVQCPLLSLPRVFGTTLKTVPAEVPYLHPDPALVAAWRARLPDDGALRVGLCWASSAHADDAGARLIDRRRSIALAELAPLGSAGGVRFVSLQLGDAARQIAASGLDMLDAMAGVQDFADTAALVANLDLVISVDTAVAHLAGALGRPVWLLSRYDGCWRWLHGRDDSPWYPTMRIYRQERPLDWAGVTARVRRDLIALAGKAAPDVRLRSAAG